MTWSCTKALVPYPVGLGWFSGDFVWFQLVSEVSLPKNQNGAILEEIQLDFDQNELEQFFSDEAATTWQFSTVICYIFMNFIKAFLLFNYVVESSLSCHH